MRAGGACVLLSFRVNQVGGVAKLAKEEVKADLPIRIPSADALYLLRSGLRQEP